MTELEKTGFFKRSKNFVQEKQAEGKAKREAAAEAELRIREEVTAKYGRLVASESFAFRRIELYEGGYVRFGGAATHALIGALARIFRDLGVMRGRDVVALAER